MAEEYTDAQIDELERLDALERKSSLSDDEMVELETLAEKYPEDKSLLDYAKQALTKGAEALAWPSEQARKAIHGPTAEGEAKPGSQIAEEMGVPAQTPSEFMGVPEAQTMTHKGVEYPTAAEPKMTESVGTLIEAVEDPLHVVGPAFKLAKPIASALKRTSARATSKMLSRLEGAGQVLEEADDFEKVALQLNYEDLNKLSGSVDKVKRTLGGDTKIELVEAGGKVGVKKSRVGSGLIGDISNDISNMVDKVQEMNPRGTSEVREKVSIGVLNKIEDTMGKTSGEKLSNEIREKMVKDIEAIFERVELDEVGSEYSKFSSMDEGQNYTLREMLDLRRNLNKKVNSGDFITGPENLAMDTKIMRAGIDVLDDAIKLRLKGVPYQVGGVTDDAGKIYSVNNARLHNLIQVKEIIKKTPLKELQKVSRGEKVLEMLVWGAAGSAAGPWLGIGQGIGFGAGALWAGARETGKGVGKMYLPFRSRAALSAAKGLEAAPTAAKGLFPAAVGAREMIQEDDMGRSPQSLESPEWVQQVDDVAEQLMLTPIPRSSDAILQNKDFFLAKVAQQMPAAYDAIKYVVDKQPEKIKEIMPTLVHGMPQFFESDKYQRVDGIVPVPLRQMAEKDLWQRDDLSLEEKTETNHKLNQTGEYPL